MLDMLKEQQRAAGGRFSEMNLSSMLAAHARQNSREGVPPDHHRPGKSDSSLSPHSPADHDREEDLSRGDEDEAGHAGMRGEGPHADSSGRDERHLSEEVRAQVFADLRRFSSRAVAAAVTGAANEQAATSTTTSPPLPEQVSERPTERTRSLEDSLPPRKRKVSQEHHNLLRESAAAAAAEAAGGFNGHDHNSRDSTGSSSKASSPVKMMTSVANANPPPPTTDSSEEVADVKKRIIEDEAAAEAEMRPSLECRN